MLGVAAKPEIKPRLAPLLRSHRGTLPDRHHLAARLLAARARCDAFFSLLAPATLYRRAIAERHRIVFYLGHLEAFDWNLLGRADDRLPSFDPEFDHLFAFGIDPVDGELPRDVPADWPRVSQIRAYVARVREELDALLARVTLDDGEVAAWEMAIEHRLMHAETLAYMLPHLPLDGFVAGAATPPDLSLDAGYARTGAPGNVRRIAIPAGCATLGRSRSSGAFGWDNEFEGGVDVVPSFTMDARNVTNGEFLAFVRFGGYKAAGRHLWRDEDRAWIESEGREHPLLWRKARGSGGWRQRFAFVEGRLAMDLPVQVSLAEARAYAAWKGRRLPTEAEFHRAAYGTPCGTERAQPWGCANPEGGVQGAFDFGRFDPAPVAAYPAGDSAFGVADLVGNGWEWTETPFSPFVGFAADPRYAGYSANFFDGRHYVVKGASAQTDQSLIRRSFRNWFQPHYPYVFAAFRCVDVA